MSTTKLSPAQLVEAVGQLTVLEAAEFVKLAEENGLITPMTDLIMRRAIDAAHRRAGAGRCNSARGTAGAARLLTHTDA